MAKQKVQTRKVKATVAIEFDAPEDATLDNVYVGVRADLFESSGDLITSAYDCETMSVETKDSL